MNWSVAVELTAGLSGQAIIVVVGAVTSKVTELSVEVEAVLSLPAASSATPAPMVATTVPSPVMPLTATV